MRALGLTASARALFYAAAVANLARPAVVFCKDENSADAVCSDILALAPAVLGKTVEPVLFPHWEHSLYGKIAPSIRTRLARASVLGRLDSFADFSVLVTTLPAARQATIPPDAWQKNSITIRREESVGSRETFTASLLDAGYLRVDPVEDPGTFAVRGNIIDVFPPGARHPLRIELFGDLVETIRPFDSGTQRTLADDARDRLAICPAREVLVNGTTCARIRERLKSFADSRDIPRTTRDPVLSSIHDGFFAEHHVGWAPFAYEKSATLWDYVPAHWPVFWDDPAGCNKEWSRFIDEQRRLSGEAPQSGIILPPAEMLYDDSAALTERISAATAFFAETLDISSTEKEDALRFFLLTNGDLARGSRHSLGDLEPKLRQWLSEGQKISVICSTSTQLERIRFLLSGRGLPCRSSAPPEKGAISLASGHLSEGFRWPSEGLIVVTDGEILGSRAPRARGATSSSARQWSGLQTLSDLSVNDHVVHVDHGVGKYLGIVRLDLSGAPGDFILVEYANRDRLYVPVYRLNAIQKYAGGEGVALDRLGGQSFARTKEKVRSAARTLAFDLIQLYAERQLRPGLRLTPGGAELREFEARFPFDETPDQSTAIDCVMRDLGSGKVMDRLVCGDVGYGKTEVAMRAAFRAASDGKQVAILVPTTVLAQQHEETFRARFKDLPFNIDSLSRFKSSKQQKTLVAGIASGKIDIVIGTHRLLSRDITFRDLGLVIVDEEHRFGVEHKERLKTLKLDTHVLTLTATPIPRTLHMTLSGLRDISIINTAPIDRLPIKTFVSRYDENTAARAIRAELARGGQVFYLHNRVQTIYEAANRISALVPEARILVAHGQMPENELERAMLAFYHKQANVLVCTSIIESGLDLPSANTVLIERADMFGLAQLYQIRGRVGRGQHRAFAYLFLPEEGEITDDARKRLEVIQRFVELGSGFSIASHDLEIRGGGDLLGPQQSGHIAAVGFDLYTELLEEAIREAKGRPPSPEESRREPEIKIPFPAYLPEEYVPDVHQRLSMYRRLSAAAREPDLDSLEGELKDRFGPLPAETANLFWVIRIKQLLKTVGVDSLTAGKERIALQPGPASRLDPAKAIALVSSSPSRFQLTPDSKFIAWAPTGSLKDLFFSIESLFKELMPRG